MANVNSEDYGSLKKVGYSLLKMLIKLEESNAKLENENNRLKVSIIDLNDNLGVGSY